MRWWGYEAEQVSTPALPKSSPKRLVHKCSDQASQNVNAINSHLSFSSFSTAIPLYPPFDPNPLYRMAELADSDPAAGALKLEDFQAFVFERVLSESESRSDRHMSLRLQKWPGAAC